MISTTLTSGNTEETAVARAARASVLYTGTFSTATIKLQVRQNGSATWVDVTDSSKTAAATFTVDLSPEWELKAVATGADGSTSVFVAVNAIPV